MLFVSNALSLMNNERIYIENLEEGLIHKYECFEEIPSGYLWQEVLLISSEHNSVCLTVNRKK